MVEVASTEEFNILVATVEALIPKISALEARVNKFEEIPSAVVPEDVKAHVKALSDYLSGITST